MLIQKKSGKNNRGEIIATSEQESLCLQQSKQRTGMPGNHQFLVGWYPPGRNPASRGEDLRAFTDIGRERSPFRHFAGEIIKVLHV
jgi:hypothetical protein